MRVANALHPCQVQEYPTALLPSSALPAPPVAPRLSMDAANNSGTSRLCTTRDDTLHSTLACSGRRVWRRCWQHLPSPGDLVLERSLQTDPNLRRPKQTSRQHERTITEALDIARTQNFRFSTTRGHVQVRRDNRAAFRSTFASAFNACAQSRRTRLSACALPHALV